jgi:hypothetical protein
MIAGHPVDLVWFCPPLGMTTKLFAFIVLVKSMITGEPSSIAVLMDA